MFGQWHALVALPQGKSRYPLNRRMAGLQDRYRRARKILPPTGIWSRAVSAPSELLYGLSTTFLCKNRWVRWSFWLYWNHSLIFLPVRFTLDIVVVKLAIREFQLQTLRSSTVSHFSTATLYPLLRYFSDGKWSQSHHEKQKQGIHTFIFSWKRRFAVGIEQHTKCRNVGQ